MLEPSDRAHLSRLLRTLLTGLGDTPGFRPAIAVKREQ